jgi:hypothetical protein
VFPFYKSVNKTGGNVVVFDGAKYQVAIVVILPVCPFILFPAAISDCIDDIFNSSVLELDIFFGFADTPYIGGMGIEKFPHEMVVFPAFYQKKKAEIGMKCKSNSEVCRLFAS